MISRELALLFREDRGSKCVCVCAGVCVCVFFLRGGGGGVRLRKDELAHDLNEASALTSGLPKAYMIKP